MGRCIITQPFNNAKYLQSEIMQCINCYKCGDDVQLTHFNHYKEKMDTLYGNVARFDFCDNYVPLGNEKLSYISTNRVGDTVIFDDCPLSDFGQRCVDIGCTKCLSWLGWKLTKHSSLNNHLLLIKEAII